MKVQPTTKQLIEMLYERIPELFDKPQRQWVGLSDEEFEDIELGCRSTPFGKIKAMQMVETKLKEKNT